MSFSELLKQCRKQKGISQAELASKLGVTQQAVGKWESGKSSPDPATVARIAEILSTTADFLLGLYRPVSNVTTPEERFFGNYAESLIPVIGTVKAGYGALLKKPLSLRSTPMCMPCTLRIQAALPAEPWLFRFKSIRNIADYTIRC